MLLLSERIANVILRELFDDDRDYLKDSLECAELIIEEIAKDVPPKNSGERRDGDSEAVGS